MNKKLSFFLAIAAVLIAAPAFTQVEDDFSDGDFTQNPQWSNSALFVVAPYTLDESNLMLRSNSPGASNYYISTPSSIVAETSWEFFFNARFSLSGANYVDAYLVADNADLTAVQNGYFVRIGRTQNDISFWKKQAGTDVLLVEGPAGQVGSGSNNPVNIRVTRDQDGLWSVFADVGLTGSFQALGFPADAEFDNTVAFGFIITQSGAAGPVNNHWFDDILVAPIPPDETPPSVLNASTSSSTEVVLTFDEPLDQATAEEVSNYSVDGGIGNPTSATFNTETLTEVTLTLATPLDEGQFYNLTVSGVEDPSGNAMPGQDVEIIFFNVSAPAFREIVFNELMADETPQVGLPDVEFIELYNTTADKFFDLSGYTYVNGSDTRTLGSAVLFPESYVILCRSSDVDAIATYGDVLGLESWPLLTNGSDSLALLNTEGALVDVVAYTDAWYQDPDKSGGGWTLEQINPLTPCSGINNWRASEDFSGGTPGAENSIFDDTPDTDPPVVTGVENPASDVIRILFSEPISEASLVAGAYSFDQGINVTEVVPRFDLTAVDLSIDPQLETGILYTLTISGLSDCAGNLLPDGTEVEILTGEQPQFADIVISEIMADPTPEVGLPAAEYMELFNASDKVIDLQGCDLSGEQFDSPRLILPGEYLMLISSNAVEDFVDFPNAYVLEGMSSTFLTNGGRELTLT
ncbi:MAG: lamin tail domain-containing protein, partial [Cryomorphaceae bacterium]